MNITSAYCNDRGFTLRRPAEPAAFDVKLEGRKSWVEKIDVLWDEEDEERTLQIARREF